MFAAPCTVVLSAAEAFPASNAMVIKSNGLQCFMICPMRYTVCDVINLTPYVIGQQIWWCDWHVCTPIQSDSMLLGYEKFV